MTDNSLFVSVNLDTEDKYEGIGISTGGNIKINGNEHMCVLKGLPKTKPGRK